MRSLTKNGRRVFGSVVVGDRREIRIPPAAYMEYGFEEGERVLFIPGDRTSGGFSILREAPLSDAVISLGRRSFRAGTVGQNGCVSLPAGIGVEPGDRLVVGRAGGLAVGFTQTEHH